MNSHYTLFIIIFHILSSAALFSFCHLQAHYFPFNDFFLIQFIIKNRWTPSLVVPHFVFNFKLRKSKQTNCLWSLIQNQLQNKEAKIIFYLKSKLNQIFVIALHDWKLSCHRVENKKNIINRLVFIVMIYHAVVMTFWTGGLGGRSHVYLAIFMFCNGLN